MPVDLEHQLAVYGEWLERRCATTLRPAALNTSVGVGRPTQVVDFDSRRPARRRSTMVLVAAASIVVIGLIGIAATVRQSPEPPAAVSVRIDPPGPLYVLPSDADLAMSDGNVSVLRGEPMSSSPSAGYFATVGTPIDEGFEDLATVSTFTNFEGPSNAWVEGTYGGLPTLTLDEDFLTFIVQDRGAWWVSVQSGPGRTDAVHDVLDHVIVDSSGQISVDVASTRVVVDSSSLAGVGVEDFTASWTASIIGASDPNVEVSTGTYPGLVVPPGGSVNRVEPTTINGVRAWRMIPGDDPPISNSSTDEATFELRSGVQWQFSPNRVVFVGGDVDIDTLERFAASLTQVTMERWATALPGFTTECTLGPRSCSDLLPGLSSP